MTDIRTKIAEALVKVTNRWVAPNFPADWKLREFAELDDREQRLNLDYADAALGVIGDAPSSGDGSDWVTVPREPTEEMWGGLARDLIMWDRGMPNQYGSTLYQHLRSSGRVIPAWLEAEIPDTRHTPPKGTVAVCIFKAMLEAAPPAPSAATTVEPDHRVYVCYDGFGSHYVSKDDPKQHVAICYDEDFAERIVEMCERRSPEPSPSTATSAEPVALAGPIDFGPNWKKLERLIDGDPTPPSSGNADAVRDIKEALQEAREHLVTAFDAPSMKQRINSALWSIKEAETHLAALSSAPVAGADEVKAFRDLVCEKLQDMRAGWAGDFKTPENQGQRGHDRTNALYEAIMLVKGLPIPRNDRGSEAP